ncbi:MAG TPA: hypothetical protein VFX95_07435 [Caulobacteraceae bacterium]|nr:hypothetical protein [Caulobacteraceae bacterium]
MAERSFFRSSAAHMAFGFLLMGGWALFANRAHGLEASWLPALAQGTISALLTGVIKKAIEWMDGRIGGPLAYVVPPLATAGSILATLFAMHSAIGTPEIAATIAFPWSISTLYAVIYNAGLVRARRAA